MHLCRTDAYFPGQTIEERTTNLEKSVAGLRASTNVSVMVRASNEQGHSPPSQAVFCSTHDGSEQKLSDIF